MTLVIAQTGPTETVGRRAHIEAIFRAVIGGSRRLSGVGLGAEGVQGRNVSKDTSTIDQGVEGLLVRARRAGDKRHDAQEQECVAGEMEELQGDLVVGRARL
jgi:hypothetical protein